MQGRIVYRTPDGKVIGVRTFDDETIDKAELNLAIGGANRLRLAWEAARHYAKALARWAAAGFPVRSDEEVERIYRDCCQPCPKFKNGRCATCNCRVNRGPAVQNKIRMATEDCRLGLWNSDLVDVVIPLSSKSKWDNNELRYALRSIEKNLIDIGRIFVVGFKPPWLTNVVHVPAEDVYKRNKDANLIRKVLLAIEAGASPRFVRMSDDQCLLRRVRSSELLPRFGKQLRRYTGRHRWWQRVEVTRKALEAAGRPTMFYDLHIPILYDRDAFKKAAADFNYGRGRGFCINTLYCNAAGADATGSIAHRARIMLPTRGTVDELLELAKDRWFINYNDKSRTPELAATMARLFPEPSRYENDTVTGPKIAVVLLTCDRFEYTVETVESLLKLQPVNSLDLYHADDASTDKRVVQYVQAKGFQTILRNKRRLGCSPTTEAAMRELSKRVEPGTLVLYLQNDFELCRRLPTQEIFDLLAEPDVAFVQLTYRRPRNRYNRRLAFYWPDGEKWIFGDQSKGPCVRTELGGGLGYHPSVAKIETWLTCTEAVSKERHFLHRTIRLNKQVARLTLPVFRHIGRLSTPEGIYGARKHRRLQRLGQANYAVAVPTLSVRKANRRRPMQAGASLCSYLGQLLRPEMHTLELGSGLSTWLFYAAGCDHTALEHEPQYAPPLPCVRITPLVGKPQWYDWKPNGKPYDVILIDGPPAGRRRHRWDRHGILRFIDKMAHPKTVIILDDTHRKPDNVLADKIAKQLEMSREDFPGSVPQDFKKGFTVLRCS